ncbi:uncharacterized protein BDZ99DRAFT_350252, partial [Mytilinidion resinicola]
MSAPNPLPTYVYKILPSAPPKPLPDVLPLSDLDANDGFIHLSTASQVPGTCGRFFADATELWLLKIRLQTLENGTGEVRWEAAGNSGVFAHLYGGKFGAEEVDESLKV